MYLAAVDIGGTKITASLADQSGILFKVYQEAKKEGDNKAIPSQVNSLIEYACSKVGVAKQSIAKVGISTCSPFEKKMDTE